MKKTINESEIRTLIKELFGNPIAPPPVNVPNYGNPEDDVVNVNAMVDHNVEDACEKIIIARKEEVEEIEDDHLYVESIVRAKIRRLCRNLVGKK